MPLFNSSEPPDFPEFTLGPSKFVDNITEESDSMLQIPEAEEKSFSKVLKKVIIPKVLSTRKKSNANISRIPSNGQIQKAEISIKKSSIGDFFTRQSNLTMSQLKSNLESDNQTVTKRDVQNSMEHRSLFFFTAKNPLRKALIRITSSKPFDYLILFFIFLNCISLAMTNPSNSATMVQILSIFEYTFAVIFLIELIMKVIAFGLILHPGSYLRNFWNILDFVIVILGFLQFLPGINNYSALRSLRALRPLRTVNGIPGLRIIVNALFLSIPPFLNVLILLLFCFCIFGILGVQLWRGTLQSRCVINGSETLNSDGTTSYSYAYDYLGNEILCSSFIWGRKCDFYKGYRTHCQDYVADNPNYGYTNFDNIGFAFLQVFQVVSGEMWTNMMFYVMDGWSDISVIYFVLLVLFGGFFIVNLALAVINDKFNQVSEPYRLKKKNSSVLSYFKKFLKKRKITNYFLKFIRILDYQSDRDSDSGSASSSEYESSSQKSIRSHSYSKSVTTIQLSNNNFSESSMDENPNNDDSPNEYYISSKRRKRIRSSSNANIDYNSSTKLSFIKLICFPLKCVWWIHRKVQRFVNHIIRNDWFGRLMLFVIVLNTIVLSIDHYGMPVWLKRTTEISNYVFIGVFTIEFFLKFYGLGISYFRDGFNLLDLVVVIASYIELLFTSSTSSSFSILRSFRLLRIFKLLSWKSLRSMTDSILVSLKSIFYLAIVFILFIFIATLIGLQLFAGKIPSEDDGRPPVQNFNDFIHSFITVFQIVTTEGWPNIFWDAMRGQEGDIFSQIVTVLYFIGTIILGDYIILNLFLAILLQSFEEESKIIVDKLKEKKSNLASSRSFQAGGFSSGRASSMSSIQEIMESPTLKEYTPLGRFIVNSWRKMKELKFLNKNQTRYEPQTLDSNQLDQELPDKLSSVDEKSTYSETSTTSSEERDEFDPMPLRGKTFFFISSTNPFRVYLKKLFLNIVFQYIHLAYIVITSLVLALDTPSIYTTNTLLANILFGIYIGIAIVYFIEIMIRIFIQGCVFLTIKKKMAVGYFNRFWNIFDVIIFTIFVVSIATNYTGIYGLHALRAVYPLRIIPHSNGLKTIFSTLIKAIPGIFNVLIICFLMFLIFGIFAVQTFSGKFHYCSVEHITSEMDCIFPNSVNRTLDFLWNTASETCSIRPEFEATIISISDCTEPMLWVSNNRWSFDNIFSSILALFEISTIEDWPSASNAAISIVGIDMQPKKDNAIYYSFFFIAFVMVGSWFIMNLFVGVILSSFNRIKENEEGSATLSDEQRVWVSTQRLFMKLSLKPIDLPPKSYLRFILYAIVSHPLFEYLISGIIFLNIIAMMLEFDKMPSTMSTVLSYFNNTITAVFVIESILKIIAFGPFQYFRDMWNTFDFFVVIVSLLGTLFTSIITEFNVNPSFLRIFRIFRIIRILRLVKTTKKVRALLETLYYSMPSLVNVSLTLLLLSFVYAIIGMNLFYQIKFGSDLNNWTNFKTFFNALLTMIRISTLDNWGSIMYDCRNQRNCQGDDCGNPWIAIPFFVSYILFNSYIVMNLFVAVILDNFEDQMRFEDSAINSSDLRHFIEIWQEFDPKATYVIKTKYLKNLLQRLGLPLGLNKDCTRAELIRKLVSLDIPEHQGEIHFIETLIPLARRVYSVNLPEKESKKLDRALMKKFSSLKRMKSTLGYTTGEYFAATFIQAAYRGRQIRKNGSAVIGLSLVKTDSGRLRFKIERKAHRYAKQRKIQKKMQNQEESSDDESEDATLLANNQNFEYQNGNESNTKYTNNLQKFQIESNFIEFGEESKFEESNINTNSNIEPNYETNKIPNYEFKSETEINNNESISQNNNESNIDQFIANGNSNVESINEIISNIQSNTDSNNLIELSSKQIVESVIESNHSNPIDENSLKNNHDSPNTNEYLTENN